MSGVPSTSGRLGELTYRSSSSAFCGMHLHGSMRGVPRLRCATQRMQPVASFGRKKYNKYK